MSETPARSRLSLDKPARVFFSHPDPAPKPIEPLAEGTKKADADRNGNDKRFRDPNITV